MSNKTIHINTGLIFLVSILLTYLMAPIFVNYEGEIAYSWGFIFGRAVTSVLIPLFLVWLVRTIFRKKPMFTKGALVSWWALFLVFSGLSILGSMLPPQN